MVSAGLKQHAYAQFPRNTAQDSIRISSEDGDSTKPVAKKVRIRTLEVNPDRLIDGLEFRKPVEYRLSTVIEPDLLGRQSGFVNSLGQIGKPYRRTVMGVESAFFRPEGLYFNPYTGAEDVYTIDVAHGLSYFDTRTPFVNIYYGQGKADLTQLRVDISQNISPFVNVGLLYYRRGSSGVYKEFLTSHNNLAATLNVHTPRDRYKAFFAAYFQEANDNMNGGVRQGFAFEDLFEKSRQPVALESAVMQRLVRAAHFRQTYSLIGNKVILPDSMKMGDSADVIQVVQRPHQLLVYNSFGVDGFDQEYTDGSVDSLLNFYQFPVYPTLGDSSFFYERFKQTRYKADGGITYRLKTERFQTGHRFEVAFEQVVFEKNHIERNLSRFSNTWKGDLHLRTAPFDINADAKVQNTVSNLFNTQPYAELGGSIGFPGEVEDYTYKEAGPIQKELDSTIVYVLHRPLRAEVRSIVQGRNPTLQQAYGAGWAGNHFISNENLRNVRFQHLRLGLTYQGKRERVRGAEVPGMEMSLFGFVSRLNGLIYYDSSMVLQQAASNENLQYVGLDGFFRVRFRQLFLENRTTYQIGSSNVGLDTIVGAMQPALYGKTSFYYETRTTRFATAIRLGLDYYYSSAFRTPLFDSPSQQFYPQYEYEQEMYHRFDVVLAATIKRANVFLKLVHANEGLLAPGYFTTTLYPMLDRTFMVGVNWTFFD